MHGHCLLWIEGFDEIRELFFDQDPLRRQAAHDRICEYTSALIMNTAKIYMQSMKKARHVQQFKKFLMNMNHKF